MAFATCAGTAKVNGELATDGLSSGNPVPGVVARSVHADESGIQTSGRSMASSLIAAAVVAASSAMIAIGSGQFRTRSSVSCTTRLITAATSGTATMRNGDWPVLQSSLP